MIGWFALVLGILGVAIEMNLQGGFINSLINIEQIRAFGINSAIKDGVNNPLVFFRMFKPFVIFSFYVFNMLHRFTKYPRYWLMNFITFILSFYVIFIGGGRTHIIIFLASVFIGIIYNGDYKKQRRSSNKIFIFVILGIITLFSLIVLDPLFSYMSYGKPIDFSDSNTIRSLATQFSFPYSNLLFILNTRVEFRFFQDYFIWILSLMPSFILAIVGIKEPVPLYEVNTINQLSTLSNGGLPSDILTLGYYQLGIAGVALTMVIFGFVFYKVDNLLIGLKSNSELKPIIFRVLIYLGMMVMYADLEGTFRSRYDSILLIPLLYNISRYNLTEVESLRRKGFKRYKIVWS